MKSYVVRLFVFGLVLLLSTSGWAQYKISHGVIGSGGTRLANSEYIHLATLGQPSIGVIDTMPYRSEVGFWYQPGYVITSIMQGENRLPEACRLDQNYPNPFNPTTTICFALPTRSRVTLKVFDVLGREVVTIIDKEQKAGVHRVTLDASQFASGVYFYRMKTGGFVQTKKLIVLK